MSEDKNTIGLTDANRSIMDDLVEKAGFDTGVDAAKFAFAIAVNRKCTPNPVEKAGTVWNVGSFDESGELKALVGSLFPDVETPYRIIEALVNRGFELLASEMGSATTFRVEDLVKRELEAR
jgi:hypothetical protein